MRRKLSLAVLLSLSAVSPPALALGVGEVDVRSTLNAPLRAVIPLTDTAGLDPERLRVSVADSREFESAGLLRTPLAASVSADVEVRQGQWVVTLASERAVREPWMDLLLRFDWPSGTQLREVTLLLDPPDYDSMPVLVSGSSRRSQPVAQVSGRVAQPTAEPAAQPSAALASQPMTAGTAWVGSGDTLWSVAGRLRPDSGISMNQMMVALVEANPDAFPSGNINAMRAGHSLVVPSREAIAARTGAQADHIVQAMNQAWANRGSGAPARVPLGPSAPAAESVQVATAATEAAERVAAAEPEPAPSALADTATPAAEAGDTAAPRLTLLSDEELAAEAARQGADVADRNLDADVLSALGGGELALGQSEPRLALLEQRWQESHAALEEVQVERDALQQELGELRDEVETMREQLAALLADDRADTVTGSGSVVVQPEGQTEETPWWGAVHPAAIDRKLLLGGAGLAALLGLWLWVRRRQRHAAAEMGSVSMPSMVHGMPPSDVASPPSPAATMMPPLAPGMIIGDDESQERETPRPAMPQAEAISEADIFMAYGRYDQAREILEASLARDPERHDQRLKLLNVHVEQGNWQAAEEEMQTLAETGDSTLLAEAARLMARRQGENERAGVAREIDEPTEEELHERRHEASPADGMSEEVSAEETTLERSRDDVPADGEGATDEGIFPPLARGRETTEATAATDAPSGDRPDEEPLATPEEEAPPTRPSQQASPIEWDVIDYRPPRLDPEPTPRVETPMQPSIEFPRMDALDDSLSASESEPSPREEPSLDEEDRWEVEEVAFPPLDRDNGATPGKSAQWDELSEARRLLESGEVERARPLLQRLSQGAESSRLREEVEALITHYRL
ncbi:type IV pilus assembly protein FimV [Billgrantia desiderata]|uniref:type IV pilus assembly protein FimV n=1 Tax=Billgrantia desiderata TaxID=52021 RepID=UPI00089F362B|nr:FimV/HubP family polar landmark protein [Halomonas desiderata]SEF56092.1 FimV N-terminal domain-containing protein [Halomonas desiderata]